MRSQLKNVELASEKAAAAPGLAPIRSSSLHNHGILFDPQVHTSYVGPSLPYQRQEQTVWSIEQ